MSDDKVSINNQDSRSKLDASTSIGTSRFAVANVGSSSTGNTPKVRRKSKTNTANHSVTSLKPGKYLVMRNPKAKNPIGHWQPLGESREDDVKEEPDPIEGLPLFQLSGETKVEQEI